MTFMRVAYAALAIASLADAAPKTSPPVTFYNDVLPVLQKHCQGCHRAGEAAPMSLLTYTETRPWAKAIREAVLMRTMPPWFADPHVGKFANDRSLTKAEVDTIVRWADTGAQPGNPKQAPAPRAFVEGWNIDRPDFVVETVEHEVPAKGTIEYTYFVIPTGFTEDKWVSMAEVRPGNRALVHHVIAFVRPPGSKWLRDAKPGVAFVPKKGAEDRDMGDWLTGYAPGTVPDQPGEGRARLIKAGSDIVVQMHYTANGNPGKDRTQVGFVFAKEPPKERVLTLFSANSKFVIPAGAANHRVESTVTLHDDSILLNMIPHMHLRGKSFDFTIVYPDGRRERVLNVPRYSFKWQLTYVPEQPISLPKGTRIECVAHYDNSANNADNPAPDSEVRYGDQSWEEMMFGFFDVAIDAKKDPANLTRAPKPDRKKSD